MSTCDYLIDISPYDPLCEHPCNLYGGRPVEVDCNMCQYKEEKPDQKDRERDVNSYEEGYGDGFDRGEEAIVQQIQAIIGKSWETYRDRIKAIEKFVDEFWKESES